MHLNFKFQNLELADRSLTDYGLLTLLTILYLQYNTYITYLQCRLLTLQKIVNYRKANLRLNYRPYMYLQVKSQRKQFFGNEFLKLNLKYPTK